MNSIKKLFSFTSKEVAFFFSHARIIATQKGLKLYTTKASIADYKDGKILIITPRKSGDAVQRNTFRRRVKAIFYEEKLYTTGKQWALYAYKDGISLTYHELKNWLTNQLLSR